MAATEIIEVTKNGSTVVEVIERGPAGPATTDASLLIAGTVSDARLSSNVPLKNTANTFTQNQTIDGDIEVTDVTKGIILKSQSNTRWRITVDNDGTLTTTGL